MAAPMKKVTPAARKPSASVAPGIVPRHRVRRSAPTRKGAARPMLIKPHGTPVVVPRSTYQASRKCDSAADTDSAAQKPGRGAFHSRAKAAVA